MLWLVETLKDGRMLVDDNPRLWYLSTSTDDVHMTKFKEIAHSYRRLTIREIMEDSNVLVSSCHEILVKKLGMHRVEAKFIPRLMS